MAAKTDTVTPFVHASNLRFDYESGWTLKVDAFAAARGEIVGIIGPNGAGKSTFLRLLAGLEVPRQGSVTLDGAKVDRRRVGFVFQRPVLFRGSVLHNVSIGLKFRHRADASAKSMEWLERFEIARLAGDDIRTLSGGQVQRVALARALATEPDVLLLDEPFANLDAVARRKWREELLKHVGGRTIVIVSHDAVDLREVAARIDVIADGVLLAADHAVARRWLTL